ncbi:MAG: response regulator [Proteobacteria bacterium]|nr:response regulator [Pseudomonadota bacterium]
MKKKILYIEDDPINMALVRTVMTDEGFELIEASNGLDGIDAAKAKRPDLILMDINMPGIDGLATTTLIKSIEELKSTPVVALTALATEEERARGLIAGCDGYITKPIDVRTFCADIERYLKGSKDEGDSEKENELLKDYSQHLVKSLEDKVRKLELMNEDLERCVEERTGELKKAQEKLLEKEKERVLLEMAGAAAHEINQPLTVIMSMSEVVLSDLSEGDDNYRLMEKINSECERAAKIVRNMGQISKYRTKKYADGLDIIDIDASSS